MAGERILITYATRFGSTAEIAERIGEVLVREGVQVDVLSTEKITTLDGCTGVVIGSLIRGGKWVTDALDFLEDHRAELSRIPVAYFTVCATLREDTPENRHIVRDYHDSILKDYPEIRPRSIGMFAGRIDYMQLSPLLQLSAKAAKIPDGDWRNWKQIDEWAKSVLPLLRYEIQP